MSNKGVKDFSFKKICPFPFEKYINMISFLPKFQIPKFEKYMGETCPATHLKEFSILCQEVTYNEDYLKRLFIRSLGGHILEWLMNIPKGSITSIENKEMGKLLPTSYKGGDILLIVCHTKLRIPTLWIYSSRIWYLKCLSTWRWLALKILPP